MPSIYYEYLFNFHVHKLVANFKNKHLLLLSKDEIFFPIINDGYYKMLKYGGSLYLNELFIAYKEFFFLGFEWKNNIPYKIANSLDELIDKSDIENLNDYFKDKVITNLNHNNKNLKEKKNIFSLRIIYRKILKK